MIFYYVAEYKNLTQAAKVLHNSQPNISRTIKLLENEIGCSLLIRSNRGISLTPEGKKLYFHVKEGKPDSACGRRTCRFCQPESWMRNHRGQRDGAAYAGAACAAEV